MLKFLETFLVSVSCFFLLSFPAFSESYSPYDSFPSVPSIPGNWQGPSLPISHLPSFCQRTPSKRLLGDFVDAIPNFQDYLDTIKEKLGGNPNSPHFADEESFREFFKKNMVIKTSNSSSEKLPGNPYHDNENRPDALKGCVTTTIKSCQTTETGDGTPKTTCSTDTVEVCAEV